jgi:hypothetical protein
MYISFLINSVLIKYEFIKFELIYELYVYICVCSDFINGTRCGSWPSRRTTASTGACP